MHCFNENRLTRKKTFAKIYASDYKMSTNNCCFSLSKIVFAYSNYSYRLACQRFHLFTFLFLLILFTRMALLFHETIMMQSCNAPLLICQCATFCACTVGWPSLPYPFQSQLEGLSKRWMPSSRLRGTTKEPRNSVVSSRLWGRPARRKGPER